MPDLIELRKVTVSMGGYEVLRELSISFPSGKSTVIMGPSGCGKSTLLKVAAGLIPPDRGSVLYQGDDLYWMSERRTREMRRANGFAFQDAALWENKSIGENLALPLRVHYPHLSEKELTHRVTRMLESGGLSEAAPLRPAQLSGGERKFVSFLRAVIIEPSLLFLDSPTGTVDPSLAERLTAMIRDIKSKGCTIIAVTHDRRLVSTLADRLVILTAGTLVEEGDFDTVKNSSDPRTRGVLAEVLGEIASFDTDVLTLLDEDNPR